MNGNFRRLACISAALLAFSIQVFVGIKLLHGYRFEAVSRAPRFSIGSEGLGGPPTGHELAFRAIMRQSNAGEVCRRLVAQGNGAGRIYGLLGLRSLHDSAFDQSLARCLTSTDSIEVVQGCFRDRQPVSTVATAISRGAYF